MPGALIRLPGDEVYDRPAGGVEGPGPGIWETLKAGARSAQDDSTENQRGLEHEGYQGLADALVQRGIRREAMTRPLPWYMAGKDTLDYDKVWAELERVRGKDPGAFSEVKAKSREEFSQWLIARRGGLAADRAALGASRHGIAGFVGQSLGDMAESPLGPLQFAVGGGGRSIVSAMIREGTVNAGQAALQVEDQAKAKARRGETMSAGEMAGNVGGAFVVAGLLTGFGYAAGELAGKFWSTPTGETIKGEALAKVWPLLRRDTRERLTRSATIDDVTMADIAEAKIGRDNMTPDQSAAVAVVRREGQFALANPYEPDFAGLNAHEAKMRDALARIMGEPVPDAPVAAKASTAPAAGGGQRARQAGSLDLSIVRWLENRGYPSHTARGIAAGIHAESRSDPTIRGGYKDRAVGIGQWLGKRREKLLAKYGPNPTLEQQLEFLHGELQGGDPGGKLVLAARSEQEALSAYIGETRADKTGWGFMRPLHGAQREGDMARGMAALGRKGEVHTGGDPGGDAIGGTPAGDAMLELDAARAGQELDAAGAALAARRGPAIGEDVAALGAPEPSLRPEYRDEMPHYLARVNASQINVDAETFQFKSGGDAFGVTDRLAHVDKWQPGFSGRVILWESEDGKLFVADGHQRTGLARRIGAKEGRDIGLNAYVLRERDGISAQDARTFAALKNIADDSGTITDMAKVLRDAGPDALRAAGVPRSAKVRHAEGVARLSPEAFGAVINKVVPEEYAATIGARLPDQPEAHMALIDLLAKAKPANTMQADDIVRQGIEAGFAGGEQVDMFGQLDSMASLFTERAKVKDAAMGRLRGLKRIFGTAAKEAGTLESAGSKIDVAASTKEALGNDEALALIDRLAWSAGPVKDAIDRAARRLADGEPLARVSADLAGDIRKIDLRSAAMDGADAGAGAGRAAGPLERPDPTDSPPIDEHAQAQLARFDDPETSDAADLLADSTRHDLDLFAQQAPDTMVTMEGEAEPMLLADMLRDLDEDLKGLDAIDVCMRPGGV